jgi:hypothetical protein
MRVHGIVISKNDWGNLATAISHVLANHADKVYVLDHGSDDKTANGLQILRRLWGERLTVYSAPSDLSFNQALLTNILTHIAEKDGADWIYVFDSDEFLITGNGGLREELKGMPSSILSIRYGISNYISFYDFDRERLDDYLELIYESEPYLSCSHEEAFDSIYNGLSSFFDYPFMSKIIYRANSNLMIQNGAHSLTWHAGPDSEVQLPSINCAHLTYISREILFRKAMVGKRRIEEGYPRSHGWQNQLLYKIYNEGWLESFWERHSLDSNNLSKTTKFKYHHNHNFKEAIAPTIKNLKVFFGGNTLSAFNGSEIQVGATQQSNFSFRELVSICSSYEQRINLLWSIQNK